MKKSFLFAFCLLLILTACTPASSVPSETTADITPPAPVSETIPVIETAPSEARPSDGERDPNNRPQGGRGNMGGGGPAGMGVDKSGDTELAAMVEQVADRFQLLTYEDSESGKTLDYALFVPEGYDEAQQYPLMLFMSDGTTTGLGAKAQLTQGWGGLIWATEAEQAKHPCFVLVPAATVAFALDDYSTSEEVDMIPRLIEELERTYSIDSKRLYTTGQSGGCMTSFHFNVTYPDLFAAALYVSGQWNPELLDKLDGSSFFYITAKGDSKASSGKADLISTLEADGVPYASLTLDAKADRTELNAAVSAMLEEGQRINLIQWELGSVLPEGSGSEHLYSFDFGYKLEAVRDFIFAQSN